MARITIHDIGGGISPPSPPIQGAIPEPEIMQPEIPGPSFMDQANHWLDGILDMAQKIDAVVGMFFQAQQVQGQLGQGSPFVQGAPGPGSVQVAQPPVEDLGNLKRGIIELLCRIKDDKGDMTLTELINWLDQVDIGEVLAYAHNIPS